MARAEWDEDEETMLVVKARAGDFSAYDILVRRYRPASVTLAAQILRSREQAEDAAQDALLAAYSALPRLDDARRFAGWLATIVRHRAFRLAQGERRVPVPLDSIILSYTPALTESLATGEENRAIAEAIGRLSEELRPVIEMYYVDDWSVREISSFLSLPETTVKWRLHTARKHLRNLLSSQLEAHHERELL
jgi:RNA polymerase sigma-70 factor (ECF subfamily)